MINYIESKDNPKIKNALKVARDLGQDTVTIGDKTMPYSTALKIQQGYTKMQNFWKNHNHRDFVRPKYSKKWKYMTEQDMQLFLTILEIE